MALICAACHTPIPDVTLLRCPQCRSDLQRPGALITEDALAAAAAGPEPCATPGCDEPPLQGAPFCARHLAARTVEAPHRLSSPWGPIEVPVGGSVGLGRDPVYSALADFLTDSQLHVSRRHASLAVLDGSLTITDEGSTNGTFVNGQRLPAGGRTALIVGDRIRLGRAIELRVVA